jgi:hypothetical protein
MINEFKYWNYRVCKFKNDKGYISYDFRDCFYNKNDEIIAYGEPPFGPSYLAEEEEGDSEAKESLKFDLEKCLKSLEKPVVDLNILDEQFKKNKEV